MNLMKRIFVVLAAFALFAETVFAQGTRRFEVKDGGSEKVDVYAPTGKEPEIVIQEGHNGSVGPVKLSADGKLLFTQGSSEAKVWNAESGALLTTIEEISGATDFSGDGSLFAYIGSTDDGKRALIVRNVLSKKDNVLDTFSNGISAGLAFSPDGKYLAVDYNNSIQFYDVKKWTKIFSLSDDKVKTYKRLTFSEDSKYLSVAATTKELSGKLDDIHNLVWDVGNKKLVSRFTAEARIFSTDISSDNKYVALGCSYGQLYVKELASDKIIFKGVVSKSHIQGIKFSSDGKKVLLAADSLKIYDFLNSAELKCRSYDTQLQSICLSADKKTCVLGGMKVYFKAAEDGAAIKTIDGASTISHLDVIKDLNLLFTRSAPNNLKTANLWNLDMTRQDSPVTLSNVPLAYGQAVFVGRDGIFYVPAKGKREVHFISLKGDTYNKVLDLPGDLLSTGPFFASADGNIIALKEKDKNTVDFYDLSKRMLLSSVECPFKFFSRHDCRFSPSGKYAVIQDGSSQHAGSILFNLQTKKSEMLNGAEDVNFSPDEKFICYKKDSNTFIVQTESRKTEGILEYFSNCTFSPDGKYIAVATVRTVKVYAFPSGKELGTINVNVSPINNDVFYWTPDLKKFIVQENSGCIKVYDFPSLELLTSSIADSNGDWLTWTPEGFFKGSENGIKNFVHIVDGFEAFDLGQFYDALYRPDLVDAKLNGHSIPNKPLRSLLESGNAPKTELVPPANASSSRIIQLNFSVTDTGGGIGSVFLTQNGRLVHVSEAKKTKVGQKLSYTVDCVLSPGDNFFEAYATNGSGKVEGRRAYGKSQWTGTAGQPNLYLLAMGVNNYTKMPKLNLSYSVPDAKGVADSFKNAPGGLYKSVNVMTLLDSDVTQASIQAAFESIAEKALPDDVFVMHIAGHGKNYDGEYYFLPSDLLIKKDLSELPSSAAVSKRFLTENLSKIPAQKILVLLDTCDSGTFVGADSLNAELAKKTALERLAHASGQIIITAAASEQSANEGYKGHGVFSYALIEGIGGKANYDKGDSVSVRELAQFLGTEVPAIAKQMKSESQTPWSSPLRDDFVLVASTSAPPSPITELALSNVQNASAKSAVSKNAVKSRGADPAADDKFQKAKIAEDGGDYSTAFALYLEAANMGHAAAQGMVSEFYYEGKGVNQDYSKAVEWANKAAKKNDANALNTLGIASYYGNGMKKDGKKAVAYLQKAVDAGLPDAANNLSYFYEGGLGVKKDYEKAFLLCKKAADAGCVDAQVHLGQIYENGIVTKQDYGKAVEYFSKASESGSAEAQWRLGNFYFEGVGVSHNYKKALDLFTAAAKKNYPPAYNSLGRMSLLVDDEESGFKFFEKGAELGDAEAQFHTATFYEVQEDYLKAVYWYEKSAEQGYAPAQEAFGELWQKGLGTGVKKEPDNIKAREWYEKAAAQNNALAQHKLSRLYYVGKGVKQDYSKAFSLEKQAAESGIAEAQYYLGWMYDHGRGCTKDQKAAFNWYEKASAGGNTDAMVMVGYCYEYGTGVQKDIAKANQWYEKAANLGNAVGQFNIGFQYKTGSGVPQDYKKALEWYQKAAAQNYSSAQLDIGFFYDKGYGVEQNDSKAFEWYKKAADNGDATAQKNLGVMYENGRGCTKSIAEAKKWYQKAANQGNEDAKKAIIRLNGQVSSTATASGGAWPFPIYGLTLGKSTKADIIRAGEKPFGSRGNAYYVKGHCFEWNKNNVLSYVMFFRSEPWPKELLENGFNKALTYAQWKSRLISKGYSISKYSDSAKIIGEKSTPVRHEIRVYFENEKTNNLVLHLD